MLFVFITLSYAEEQSVVSKIYLRINGHEYELPDEVAREFSNYYGSSGFFVVKRRKNIILKSSRSDAI